ncbi:hypothetical protein [Geomonas subterranea]|uniref:Uncharacterized protein n=1 Tax=Geomonas subterranea TaxID=2847989 RepID=A0ABX8LN81_9BACT|nr:MULTISPECIES: hypothetical protein [Geomonas]QXE92084.1 hypothetical protein KP001_06000 [Geomonas subterranea]QXM09823.1 hypothetical protein KP002_01495 [Geomonas subterranea]
MDDETFKNEVLDRLQQIMDMLAGLLPEACIEDPEEAPVSPAAPQVSDTYGIRQELQDDYDCALEKWKLEHGST